MPEHTDHWDVLQTIHRYAQAIDDRDWELMDSVFTEDAKALSGHFSLDGRSVIVDLIRSFIATYGFTQHAMHNALVSIDGDSARATLGFRAFHQGGPANPAAAYESMGEYHADLLWTADGWRVAHWREEARGEIGQFREFFAGPIATLASSPYRRRDVGA